MRKAYLALFALAVVVAAVAPLAAIYLSKLLHEEPVVSEIIERSAVEKLVTVSNREYVLNKPLTWIESIMAAGGDVTFFTLQPLTLSSTLIPRLAMAGHSAMYELGLSNCTEIKAYIEAAEPVVVGIFSREDERRFLLDNECRWLKTISSTEESWYASIAIAAVAKSKYLKSLPKDLYYMAYSLTVVEVGEGGVERIRIRFYNVYNPAEREELKTELKRLASGRILFIYDQLQVFWHDLFNAMVSEGADIVILRYEDAKLPQSEEGVIDLTPRIAIHEDVLSSISDVIPPSVMFDFIAHGVGVYYVGGRVVKLYTHSCYSLPEEVQWLDCEKIPVE